MARDDNQINKIARYQNMIHFCDQLPGHRILVLGDIMVDEYIWGEVQRISPEAPVPVVHVRNETTQLGGAANVVNNLRSLEADVELAGVVGSDDLGRRVIAALNRLGINSDGIVQSSDHQTIRKTRIIAHNQQVVRVDRETVSPISRRIEDQIISYCLECMKRVDGVVISDYAKGAITPAVAQAVIQRANESGKICSVDPKVKNVNNYAHCSVITPNHHEAAQISGITIDEPDAVMRAGQTILDRLGTKSVLITCGERGMALFEPGKEMETIDTVAQSVYDVTGAGDTVISALTLALTAGLTYKDSALLANFAAGVVVGKVGTATTTIAELKKAMRVYST